MTLKMLTMVSILGIMITVSNGQAQIARAGGEIGGGQEDKVQMLFSGAGAVPSDLIGYCPIVKGILNNALRMSQLDPATPAERRSWLVSGLQAAQRFYQGWPPGVDTLTRDAINRGLELNLAFSGRCKKDDVSCQLSESEWAYNFLTAYYDHTVSDIIPLDEDYYIPYQRNHYCNGMGGCNPRIWWNSLYVHYRSAASAKLELLVDQRDMPTGLPVTFGSPLYRYKATEKLFKYVSEDLNRSPFREMFSCVNFDLATSAAVLRQKIKQGRSSWGPQIDYHFVRAPAESALEVLDSVGCFYPAYYPEWTDASSGDFPDHFSTGAGPMHEIEVYRLKR